MLLEMALLMYGLVTISCKSFWANSAAKRLLTSVYTLMVNPAGFVPEDLATALKWALIEPFSAGIVRYL